MSDSRRRYRNATWLVATVSVLLGLSLAGCTHAGPERKAARSPEGQGELATFAGGCFWCMEPPFEKLYGVHAVVSGYTGGDEKDPTYDQVSAGKTSHLEAVQVRYDPARVTFEELVEVFWRQIDPTDDGGQFADRGNQYRTAIFVETSEERKIAERSRKTLDDSGKFDRPVVTDIRDARVFYPAEEYHQDYYKKHPAHYKRYRYGSGRTPFLEKTWGHEPVEAKKMSYDKPTDAELRERLTPLQYDVTQEEGTERPFSNEFWDNKAEGIYVDVVSGEPLFLSTDKYKSGTGWPSFTRPLESENIVEKTDSNLGMVRTEVRSKHGDSHLGHLFPDGPEPTGQRYCINSAALRFIPREDLESEGYGEYAKRFEAESD